MDTQTQPTPAAPAAEPASKTEQMMLDVRKMPIFKQLIPMEAAVGWPIPLRKKLPGGGVKVYAILPFFGLAASADKGERAIFAPFATMTLEWTHQVPVEYVNLRFRLPELETVATQPVGTFPHDALREKYPTVGEYRQARSSLLGMYDEMFESLVSGHNLSGEWTKQFGDLLSTLVEPGLLPFYRALGPKFFERFVPDTGQRETN